MKAIGIKCSQNMCCFRNKNVINLPLLCYNSDNFRFVMSVYHIIHHTKISSWYVKFLLIYEDFYPREKKSCVIFLSISCHWDQMVIIWPLFAHLTRDLRLMKIRSFIFFGDLASVPHFFSSPHAGSMFWEGANVHNRPKSWHQIFLKLSINVTSTAKRD